MKIVREDGGYTYYDYDALHRLIGEEQFASDDTSLYAFDYTYDAAGNRLSKSFNGVGTYYSYNTLNQIEHEATDGECTYYHFDACGSQVAKQELSGTTYYQYGHENLMTRIDFADGSHNYFAWDADSKRVAADDSSGHTDFIYRDPHPLSLIMERDGAGQTKATYTLGDGLEAMRRNGSDHFYHFDWLGSTFALTDVNEDITDTWRYDAWGNVLVRTGTTENPHTYVGRLRYYWRPDPVMYLLARRLYESSAARFTSPDPIPPAVLYGSRPPVANLYSYANGNSPRLVDPSGMSCWDIVHYYAQGCKGPPYAGWAKAHCCLAKVSALICKHFVEGKPWNGLPPQVLPCMYECVDWFAAMGKCIRDAFADMLGRGEPVPIGPYGDGKAQKSVWEWCWDRWEHRDCCYAISVLEKKALRHCMDVTAGRLVCCVYPVPVPLPWPLPPLLPVPRWIDMDCAWLLEQLTPLVGAPFPYASGKMDDWIRASNKMCCDKPWPLEP